MTLSYAIFISQFSTVMSKCTTFRCCCYLLVCVNVPFQWYNCVAFHSLDIPVLPVLRVMLLVAFTAWKTSLTKLDDTTPMSLKSA